MKKSLIIASVSLLLVACGSEPNAPDVTTGEVPLTENSQTGRWYNQAQIKQGRALFAKYCAACHGAQAEATADWKTPDASGNYPPPPLNGSAHAWHHPLAVLDQVISEGTADMGGNMPAWGKVINAEQRLALIAGFQAYWSDEIYAIWLEREVSSRGD